MAHFCIKSLIPVIIIDDISLLWVILCGVADVKIFLEKKGGGKKPHVEESALEKCLGSTHTNKTN
jgi:hypothetical protein